jgi:hypothetical protein
MRITYETFGPVRGGSGPFTRREWRPPDGVPARDHSARRLPILTSGDERDAAMHVASWRASSDRAGRGHGFDTGQAARVR